MTIDNKSPSIDANFESNGTGEQTKGDDSFSYIDGRYGRDSTRARTKQQKFQIFPCATKEVDVLHILKECNQHRSLMYLSFSTGRRDAGICARARETAYEDPRAHASWGGDSNRLNWEKGEKGKWKCASARVAAYVSPCAHASWGERLSPYGTYWSVSSVIRTFYGIMHFEEEHFSYLRILLHEKLTTLLLKGKL